MRNHVYTDSVIITYPEGDQSLERSRVIHREDINDKLYTIKEEDTLTSIADRYYQNSFDWYIIADVNNIDDPLQLTIGMDIIIPNLERYNI